MLGEGGKASEKRTGVTAIYPGQGQYAQGVRRREQQDYEASINAQTAKLGHVSGVYDGFIDPFAKSILRLDGGRGGEGWIAGCWGDRDGKKKY